MKGRYAHVLAVLALAALAGCGAQLRSDFVPAGADASLPQAGSIPLVGAPADVKVYFGLPDGFALNGNVLAVEKGFDHRIRGYINVVYDKGMCDSSKADKKTVIQQLQQTAHSQGANAVVLAHSALSDKPGFWDVCSVLGKPFGHGWAVTLQDSK